MQGARSRGKVLTDKQAAYVLHYMECLNIQEAAQRAGYPKKNANAVHWNPLVQEHIQFQLKKLETTQVHKAEDIVRILQVGAFLDNRQWFEPGSIEGNLWRISEDNFKKLPVDVARHIKAAEYEVEYETNEENEVIPKRTGYIKVKLTDRETLIGIVAKHMLGDKVNVSGTIMHQIDWSKLVKVLPQGSTAQDITPPIQDPIEAKILGLSKLALEDRAKESPPITSTILVPQLTPQEEAIQEGTNEHTQAPSIIDTLKSMGITLDSNGTTSEKTPLELSLETPEAL